MSAELATAHAAQNGVQGEPNSADKNVEMWKIKKLIKSLEAARGFVYYYPNLLVYKFYLFFFCQYTNNFGNTIFQWNYRNGTSMISLIIPPKDQISRISRMLADEYGTASNIKSRVNRLSVLGAITSVQQRLKLYNRGTVALRC